MIFAVKFKRYIADTDILGIIISKLCYKKKLCTIILFKVDKSLKFGFYYTILPLNIVIDLRIKED